MAPNTATAQQGHGRVVSPNKGVGRAQAYFIISMCSTTITFIVYLLGIVPNHQAN